MFAVNPVGELLPVFSGCDEVLGGETEAGKAAFAVLAEYMAG